MSDGSALSRLGATMTRLMLIHDMLTEDGQSSVALCERLGAEHGHEVGWEVVLDACEYLTQIGLAARSETGWVRRGS